MWTKKTLHYNNVVYLPKRRSLSSRRASRLSLRSCFSISWLILFCSCASSLMQHAMVPGSHADDVLQHNERYLMPAWHNHYLVVLWTKQRRRSGRRCWRSVVNNLYCGRLSTTTTTPVTHKILSTRQTTSWFTHCEWLQGCILSNQFQPIFARQRSRVG